MKIENNRRNGNFTIFTTALEYIEENLGEEFSQEDIARECCCSLSTLQKLWRYCTHMSIKEYITKRRMTCAGRDLLNTDINVLDIAVKMAITLMRCSQEHFQRYGVCRLRLSKTTGKDTVGCVRRSIQVLLREMNISI